MIETTYMPLAQAAEMLATDNDTLLIAAAEGRVRGFWLLNATLRAQLGQYVEIDAEPGEPDRMWMPCALQTRHFMFIPLARNDAAELLKSDDIQVKINVLSKPDADGNAWHLDEDPDGNDDEQIPERNIQLRREYIFFEVADIKAIIGSESPPAADTVEPTTTLDRSNFSDNLAWLNQASHHWWPSAIRKDPASHPTNIQVAAWLTQKGMSQSLARKGASIIRPKWAYVGRKPDA